MIKNMVLTSIAAMFIILLFAADGAAYVGPGAGLSAIGSLLALLAALAVTVLGFVWYPIKRMRKKKNKKKEEHQDS